MRFWASLALAFNAFTLRPSEPAAAPRAVVLEETRAPLDPSQP